LLRDTDTKVLLETIRKVQDPWKWFQGDWPLYNHFYRPVSTLFFELDSALYGDWAPGYGLTNALLCAACIVLLAWAIRELTDSPLLTSVSTGLFAIWHGFPTWKVLTLLQYLWIVILVVGFYRHRFNVLNYVPVALVAMYFTVEVYGIVGLYGRMIAWIPGRTASVMTVFCLLAIAMYARFERLSATRTHRERGPLDPPATRNTETHKRPMRLAMLWPIVSLFCVALALASYEQAVMLPAVLMGVAVAMRLQGYSVRWAWSFSSWSLLAGYLVLRRLLLPQDVSGYQDQQLRSGVEGIFLALSSYVFPALGGIRAFLTTIEMGFIVLLTASPWNYLLSVCSQVMTVIESRREWVVVLTGYLLSILAFLPMAWLKEFEHYHYWPMAMRSLMVAGLAVVVWRGVVIAASRPIVQAPQRLEAAPGSLPRP
jgi:hypothetical protein